MSVSVKVVKDNWKDVSIRITREVEDRVRKVALDFTRGLDGEITTKQLVDTGNYRRSWVAREESFSPRDWYTWTVGSPVEYGPYLEYGTRFMPARPHVLPAAQAIERAMLRYFQGLDRP